MSLGRPPTNRNGNALYDRIESLSEFQVVPLSSETACGRNDSVKETSSFAGNSSKLFKHTTDRNLFEIATSS